MFKGGSPVKALLPQPRLKFCHWGLGLQKWILYNYRHTAAVEKKQGVYIGLEAFLLKSLTFDPIARSDFASDCIGQCDDRKDGKLKIMRAGQISLGVILEPACI